MRYSCIKSLDPVKNYRAIHFEEPLGVSTFNLAHKKGGHG